MKWHEYEIEQTKKEEKPKQTLFFTCSTLVKCILGIGVFVLQGTGWQIGWLPILLILLFFTLLSACSMHFLMRVAVNCPDLDTFKSLGSLAFSSNAFRLLFEYFPFVYLGTITLVYFSETRSCAIGVLRYLFSDTLLTRAKPFKPIVTFFVSCLLFLFSAIYMKSKPKYIRLAIFSGLACVGFNLLLSFIQGSDNDKDFSLINYALFKKYPLTAIHQLFFNAAQILLTYSCQFTVLKLVPLMERASPKRRKLLIIYSHLLPLIIYSLCIVIPNGRTNIPRVPVIIFVLKQMLLMMNLVLVFPLVIFDPLQKHLFQAKDKKWKSVLFLFCLFLLSTMVISILDRRSFVQLISLLIWISASPIALVFPAALFLKLRYKYPASRMECALAWSLISIGILLIVLGSMFACLPMA